MTDTTDSPAIMESIREGADVSLPRRRFLVAAASVTGAGAVGLFAGMLVDNMNPGREVAAQGAPVDVDVSKIEPGQLITVQWKKKPVWVLNRPQSMLATLSESSLLQRLKDPHSQAPQQPGKNYINGNFRSLHPGILVVVALCTHMQCVPDFKPTPYSITSWWEGGFHCPCHGSTYDLAGRVFAGSPAPLNLPIPPYYWKSDKVVRIGESGENGNDENWRPQTW